MVKKKIKPPKKGRKRALKEDVHATTSLPPSVEGQLRCFLRVSISKIVWLCAKPPDTTHVRLRWWGETTEGSLFRPLDVKNPQKTATRTVARFPVRCGPKQFAAYLSDMGALVVEVLKGPTMQPIGKAQINEIGHLAPQVPINGFFSVFSNKSADKIAELHISLVFEHLPAAYDSSSSIPTTDLSVATAGTGTTAESASIQSQPVRTGPPLPMPWPRRIASSSSEDPFMSPIPKRPQSQNHTDLNQIITPRGVDDEYSFVIGPGKVDEPSHHPVREKTKAGVETKLGKRLGEGQSSDTDYAAKDRSELDAQLGKKEKQTTNTHDSASVRRLRQLDPTSMPGSDLISALLDRGTKLRDNMIRSELDRVTTFPPRTAPGVPGVTAREILTDDISGTRQRGSGRRRSSGDLLREILRTADDAHKPNFANPAQETTNSSEKGITDTQTIELLVGDQISKRELNDLKTLQSDLSPQFSVSSESESLSETEDPLHDQSLLEDLFYKRVRSSSDSSPSDLSSSEDNEDSAKKKTKTSSKRKHRQRRWSYESSLSDPGNQRPPSRTSQHSPKPSSKALPTEDSNIGRNEKSDPYVNRSQLEPTTMKERLKKTRRRSSNSRHDANSDSDSGSMSKISVKNTDEIKKSVDPTEGLSIQRLTLLGRIHVARVMIDSLSLRNHETQSGLSQQERRPSRGGKGRGKPPRPSPKTKKKKSTYFVEYRFPVATPPRERSLVNTTATEIMRLVSKKVDDKGEVTFGHRSVFPVRFDGTAVDNWWRHLLVFKVFSRTAGQKSPSLLGVASLSLRSILQSPDLAMLDVQLDVKDKMHSDSTAAVGEDFSRKNTPIDSIIGTLKVSIELAADGKDFPMALARMKVAEMRGGKIVPLPSNQTHLPIKIPTGSADSESKSSSRNLQTESVSTQVVERELVGNKELATSSRSETEGAQKHQENSQRDIQMKYTQGEDEADLEQLNRGKKSNEDVRLQQQKKSATNVDYEAKTLHCLLAISEGRAITVCGVPPPAPGSSMPRPPPHPHAGSGVGISGLGSGRDRLTRNTYLVCRLFWSDDSVRSNVCWGTTEPEYNFIQVSPVLLTASLMERARNNCMVVEVWDKKTSAQNDQLVGIAKLPLHQFYMSFRDDRIAGTLLKSQYPVAAVDNYINIMDPFTGVQYGQLKVLLALGSAQQVSALQRLKFDKDGVDTRPLRPCHYLERGEALGVVHPEQDMTKDELVEHIFEVIVEGIRGLPQLDDTVWGEADCFIQYHFPAQAQPRRPDGGPAALSVGPVLLPHQTPTTLCMPDPTFHDVSRHRLQLPSGTPVQRELLTACAGVGGGAGGIPFEVWCRYYYPNVRDQVIAKTCLPLAKLCAMVTMQRRGEPSIQTFSLPLRLHNPNQESMSREQQAKLKDAGLLDVTVNYRHNVIKESASIPKARETRGAQVCLSVGILRACGLKSAAVSLAQTDSSLQYASEVGVNAYVKMKLSFLSKQDVRMTQTVARTFAPEFSHHVDFPCPLLMEEGESDHLSLAEALETAEMTLEIWHQVPGFKSDHDVNFTALDHGTNRELGISTRRLFAPTGDVLLGTITVSLHSLLSHKTGLLGWYPISIPNPGWTRQPVHQPALSSESPKSVSGRGLERVGGGLELSIKFAHQGDRDRVIDASRRVGWSPDQEIEGFEELWDGEGTHSADINVHVDCAWFPVHVALRPGQQALDTAAKAYIRYKLYDKESVCSKLCYLDVDEENIIAGELRHSRCFQTALTPPLAWYLREERLEIQLWVSYSRELSQTDTGPTRPRQRDKLIGCAYVDMSALCDRRIRQHRVSGLYPVFRPGAADLGGSCLRVHLSLKHVIGEAPQQFEFSDEADYQGQNEARHVRPMQHHRTKSHDQNQPMDTETAKRQDDELKHRQEQEAEERRMTEPVLMSVAVERAMHLAVMLQSNRSENCHPSCYVTFQPATGPPVHTATVPNTDQPIWGFEQEVKISSEVLDRQSFIFKVWHQTSSEPDMNSDRMLGFASVDLAPLISGFRSLNGWYNILDFAGHCQGQIKVSITPKGSVSPLKRSPKPKTTPNTSAVFAQSFPILQFPALPRHQPIQPSTSQTDPPTASHYQEHLQNVRKFHEDLHDRLKAPKLDSTTAVQGSRQKGRGVNGAGVDDTGRVVSDVSRSFLMQNLRQNMEELDSVYHGLQQKLASPVGSDLPNKHESKKAKNPSQNLTGASTQDVPGNRDDDTNSIEHVKYNANGVTSSEELRKGPRRTSDDLVLEKIREELRNEDNSDYDSANNFGGHLRDEISDAEGQASPAFESDWEDNVQFHEDGDTQNSDQNEDFILPRPLNDVSSANYSNAVRPDAILTNNIRAPLRDHSERRGLQSLSDKEEENSASCKMDSLGTSGGQRMDLVSDEPEFDSEQDLANRVEEVTSVEHLSSNSREVGTKEEQNLESEREITKPRGDNLGRIESGSDTENIVSDAETPERFQTLTGTSSSRFENEEHLEVVGESDDLVEQRSLNNQYTTSERELDQGLEKNIQGPNNLHNSGRADIHDEQRIKHGKKAEMFQDNELSQKMQADTNDFGDNEIYESSSDDSVVITIDSRQVEKQTEREKKTERLDTAKCPAAPPARAKLPNFFLPASDLEASMRALHNVTSVLPRSQPRQVTDDYETGRKPTDATRELTQRLATRHSEAKSQGTRLPARTPPYKLPTAEEARRIAKIFASRSSQS